MHDINILDEIGPEAGAFYVMDRAYVDFERLFVFTLCSSFFVVRTKKNILLQRRYVASAYDKSTGLRSDQTVILAAIESAQAYPDPLRRVSYFDARTNKRLKFLTNNFALPALTIAHIYKSRWQIELFFKMDQATSANQLVLRHQRERRQDADPGSLSRFTCFAIVRKRHRAGSESLPDSTDSQRYAIRKNAPFTGTLSGIRLPKRIPL